MNKIKYFALRGSMILFFLCLFMVFILDKGSAEQVVVLLSMGINLIVFIVSLILVRRDKDDC